jgi:Cytochrome c554 and c-prime
MSSLAARALRMATLVSLGFAAWACESSDRAGAPSDTAPSSLLTRDELMDPEHCQACHPRQYEEWAGSMHAYAADDPVFRAMNRRGQRETGHELGDFCVKCHAPMALIEGATRDGSNLDELPAKLRGVTCYFCHNAIDVGEHFNNDVQLANDITMRAAIDDPVDSPAHRVGYSAYLDSNRRESAQLCGSCHDVVTPSGVHLERTFEEYKSSLFGQLEEGFETCAGCHMPGRRGRAAELPAAPERTVHEHLWPGVDLALSPFPGRETQRQAIECELAFNTRIRSLEHDGLGTFTVLSETSAGHRQPSGAAQDRRMWIEVVAYDPEENVVFESGVIGDREPEDKMPADPDYDPQLALYRDWIYDADGEPTHRFWEAAPSSAHPDGRESLTLPFTIDPAVPHTLSARYTIARHREIARMTVRLRMRPIGIDVLRDLVRSGDLDEGVIDRVPTFTLHGAAVEWRPDEPMPRSLLPDDLTCPRYVGE